MAFIQEQQCSTRDDYPPDALIADPALQWGNVQYRILCSKYLAKDRPKQVFELLILPSCISNLVKLNVQQTWNIIRYVAVSSAAACSDGEVLANLNSACEE